MTSGNGQQALATVEAALKDLGAPDLPSEGHNGGPGLDVGIENMQEAAKLAAQTARNAHAETAKRALESVEALEQYVAAIKAKAESWAEAVRTSGDELSAEIEDGFRRAVRLAGRFTPEQ